MGQPGHFGRHEMNDDVRRGMNTLLGEVDTVSAQMRNAHETETHKVPLNPDPASLCLRVIVVYGLIYCWEVPKIGRKT